MLVKTEKQNGNLIFVKSITSRRKALLGNPIDLHSQTPISSKTKIGATKDYIKAMYHSKYGCLANGLSYKPWIEDGKAVTDDKGNELSLQQKKEKQWHLPKDFLTPHRSKTAVVDKQNDTFYSSTRWALKDGTTVFDLNTMNGDLGYHVLLDNKFVANSEKEWLGHQFPYSKWYIALTTESEDIKYERNERRSKAFAVLHSKGMTDAVRAKFVALLGIASPKTQLSTEQLHNLLFDFIDKSTFTAGSNLDQFEQLAAKLKTNPGREEINASYLLLKATHARVVNEKQGTYTWVRPDGPVTLGKSKREALEFLSNTDKFEMIEELSAEIDTKLYR
jgi:hypothetical protein